MAISRRRWEEPLVGDILTPESLLIESVSKPSERKKFSSLVYRGSNEVMSRDLTGLVHPKLGRVAIATVCDF